MAIRNFRALLSGSRSFSSLNRARKRPLLAGMENLESRALLASNLTALEVDSLAGYVAAGGSLGVSARVQNGGDAPSGGFTVEYRLSSDSLISATDILLGSMDWESLEAGQMLEQSTSVTVPSTVEHGEYYLGLLVTPNAEIGDGDPSDNAVADASATDILYSQLAGTVVYNNSARSVSIRSAAGASTPIFDDRTTWIVVHGRNSSPSSSNLVAMASAVDGYSAQDQVLVIDWSNAAASGLLGGAGENYIKPVAAWAAAALSSYGVEGAELNLIGHSWGAYVAAELAERMPGGVVDSIIALDPAVDYPGGSYNPTASGEVDFARNSNFSWSFYAYNGSYGSATTARTADEAFVVTASDHSKVVNVAATLITWSYAAPTPSAAQIGAQFQLDRLLNGQRSSLWVANRYDSAGKASSRGPFEAVVRATGDGLGVYSLTFFDGKKHVTYLA